MFNETIILLQNLTTVSSGSVFSYTNKTPGPGYYRQDESTRTVLYDFTNFVGTIKIQASLDLYPGNDDWFDVTGTTYTTNNASNSTESYSFNGNFIWIRVAYNLQSGRINRVSVGGITITTESSGGSSIDFANITNKPTTLAGYGITDSISASDLGAFEFTGSTISTTDSSGITIDQTVTVSSDLTVSGDIVPSIANGGNLGSLTKPFRSLYVSNNTVFLGGVPLSLEAGTNELKINNVPISQTITYADIPNVPTDIADLTDTGGLLGGGGGGAANTGDITFANSTISAGNEDEIIVQAKDINGFATARLNLEPVYSNAQLSAYSAETVETFTQANGDFATGVWQNNGFGNGVVSFTGAQNIGDFFQNTLMSLTAANVSITINSEPAIIWNGGTNGPGTSTPGFGTNPTVPASPITITSIVFRYRSQSFVSVNQDNLEIRLKAQNANIRMDADLDIRMFADSQIEIQSGDTLSISAGESISISNGSNDTISISTGDLNITAFDDVNFRGSDSFRIRNTSATAPIRIITDDNNTQRTWAFNPDGNLTLPGNLHSEGDISIEINLADSTRRIWRFGEDGELTFPDGTSQSTAATAGMTASSSATLTNKTFDVSVGSNNIFSIQGNQVSSYTGSGSIVVLSQSPTISVLNISDSQINLDGGSGIYYWGGQSGVAQAGDLKAGVYASDPSSNNSLFTFGTNGSNKMSVGVEGSLFVGTAMPSNNGGLNSSYAGWLVVQAGAKFGGDLNTLGNFILDTPGNYVRFGDGTTQTTAADFGYLDLDKDTIKGTAGYQYTFATDGYFTSSTSSESLSYFFVTYNTTNANIAAGWTVVGGTANTTVSSVTYPVAGYPGVIQVNLTQPAASTAGFYPVTVTSPDRLRVEIQPNPGTSDKFAFTTSGLTFPDATVQTTAYTGLQTSLVGAVDNNVLIRTSETIVTNNLYTNTVDFSTDVDIGGGTIISGWIQRNADQIEISLFGPAAFRTYLTGLSLGRTVTVTYSTAGGNQTLTRPLTQIFANIAQEDPSNPGWYRVAGRIDATLPADQTGIVSVNFPVTTTPQRDWTFSDTGSLTFPDASVQTTAYTGTANLATVARNIESEGDVNIRVNLTDSTTRIWRFGEDGDLAFPDGTTQTTAYTGSRSDLVLDAISTFGGGGVDYQASEFKFVGNNSNFPINRVRNLLINSLMENRSTGADENVSLLVEPLVENPVYCDLTLISDSDPSQVWQYRVAHIGRDNTETEYRSYFARFNLSYSNDSAIIRVVISNSSVIADSLGPYNSNGDDEDWFVEGISGSSILSFTIADSTRSVPRNQAQIGNFFKAVVDDVIYDGATEITDAETLRTRFYANIDSLVSAIGGNLYHNFRAFGSTRSFSSVPISSATSTAPAEITFNAHRDGGRYQSPGISIAGSGFQVGQTITILGSTLDQYSTDHCDSLDGVHDATVTITGVDGSGGVTAYTIAGEGLARWDTNSIGDGGDDQYDTANRYNTNLLHQTYQSDGSTTTQDYLAYNSGFVTTDDRAQDAFGAGSKYVIAYRRGIVALFATGCTGVTWFGIQGNSGRDGNGTVIEDAVILTRAYNFDVLCLSGPEYLPQDDDRFRMILRRTDEQSLVRFYKGTRNNRTAGINQDTYLQSLHDGDFYVKGNDRLYVTANKDVIVEAGDGMPGSVNGKDIYIRAGDGIETRAILSPYSVNGQGGSVNINSGNGGIDHNGIGIVSITKGLYTTVTFSSAIGISSSNRIKFSITGMTELNNDVYTFSRLADNQIELDINSTNYGDFVSGTAVIGRIFGDVNISSRDVNGNGFHGRLALNQFYWPDDGASTAEGQYLRIKSYNSGSPILEFAGDVTASIARNIESEGDVSIRVNLTDSTTRIWRFGEDGDLAFPDGTTQTTAFAGNAATVDITNTNGIDTNYSITFVETRDATQILRADVDLTFNSATNLLTAGNVAIKQTLTGGMDDGGDFIITSQSNPDRNNACNIGIYPGGATGTASEAGFVSITGGGSDVVGLAGGDVYIRGGAHTNGGVGGTVKVESVLKIDDGVHEKFQALADAIGTVTHDCASGHIFYHTSPDNNWTANFTNLNLASGYATAVTVIIVQGATGYYPGGVRIDGASQLINWPGGIQPTPSTNRTDVVTFSIINNSGTYTVLGQLTGF